MHVNFISHRKLNFDLSALKELKLNNMMILLIVGTSLLLMGVFGLVQKFRLDSIMSERTMITQVVDNMKTELASKGVSSSLLGKSTLLSKYNQREDWSATLYQIAESVTDGIWVQSIKCDGAKRMVEITGESPSQNTVAEFMDALNAMEGFGKVRLQQSSIKGKTQTAVEGDINFTIQVALK